MRILVAFVLLAASVFAESFGGIGVTIQASPLGVQVVTVIPNSQASLNGIEAGDQILSANGVNLAGKSLTDNTAMLRGEAGSKVVVSFAKASDGEVRTAELTRVGLQVQTMTPAELSAWYSSSTVSSKDVEHLAMTKAAAGYTLLGILQSGHMLAEGQVQAQEISSVYQASPQNSLTPAVQNVQNAGVSLLGFDRQGLHIQLANAGTVQAQVFDMQGALVKSWRVDDAGASALDFSWDAHTLATGAYTIRVQQGSALSTWSVHLQ